MSLFAESKNVDLVMADMIHYNQTASALGLRDTKISYDVTTISYMVVNPKYLLLGAVKFMPKQNLGTTYLGTTPIVLKQELWKYEFGAAYKFYLSDKFFIAPALLFSDYYSSLYKIIGSTVGESKTHDIDVRFYGLVGYKISKASSILVSLELDNDIFSNDYAKDYSQYAISATLFQFLSNECFMFFKYQQALKDQKARGNIIGNANSVSYGFGMGMKF